MAKIKPRTIGLLFLAFCLTMLLFRLQSHSSLADSKHESLARKALAQFHEQFHEGVKPSVGNYGDFEVSHVRIVDDWARIHIISQPESVESQESNKYGPIFRGAVAQRVGGQWVIYFDNTEEFESIVPQLPLWLSHLAYLEAEVTVPFSVPAMPWEVGTSWRFNQDFHMSYSYDFGTPIDGPSRSAAVHTMDAGEIIATDGTCVTIQRNDGLQIFYQHIDSDDVSNLSVGQYKHMGDYLGQTTTASGCGGSSGGHHVHVQFRNDGTPIDPSAGGGSLLNDWRVSSTSGDLTRGSTTLSQGFNVHVSHRGCPDWQIALPAAAVFDKKNCTGNWSLVLMEDGIVPLVNVGMENDVESIKVRPGHAILVWLESTAIEPACYDGSLWDLSKDYFPGTDILLWNNIEYLQVIEGSCETQPIACTIPNPFAVRPQEQSAGAGTCDQAGPPPPEEPPLPPGPRQETTVKLFGYANYEGPVYFSGQAGASNEPNGAGYSLHVPDGWSVIVYDSDNNSGGSRCWNSSVANLQDHGWHNRIQSLQIYEDKDMCRTEPPDSPGPQVFLYSNPNYLAQLWAGGVGFTDNISTDGESIKVPSGWSAFVYRGDKRQIKAQCFNRNVPDLAHTDNWQNKIRGIEVFDADLCEDSLYPGLDWMLFIDEGVTGENRGSSAPYEMASVHDVGGLDMNDKISSIRIRAGYSIKVWEHDNFQGGSRCFSSTVTTMRNDAFNNAVGIYQFPDDGIHDSRISSFKVYTNHFCDGSPAMPETGWAYLNNSGGFVLSAAGNSDQSITVNWKDSGDNTTLGYRIYEFDQEDYELVAETDASTTQYTIGGLPCGQTFHFLVKSFNRWGESAAPHLVVASTATCYIPPPVSHASYLPSIMNMGASVPTPAATPTPVPTAPPPAYYSEQFEADTGQWPAQDNTGDSSRCFRWYQASGEYRLQVCGSRTDEKVSPGIPLPDGDYEIDVDARFGMDGGTWTSYGIIFDGKNDPDPQAADLGDYYMLWVLWEASNLHEWKLLKDVPGDQYNLTEWEALSADVYNYGADGLAQNNWRIQRTEDRIRIYVNDHLLADVAESRPRTNNQTLFGLYGATYNTGSAMAAWDNFSVYD